MNFHSDIGQEGFAILIGLYLLRHPPGTQIIFQPKPPLIYDPRIYC